MPFHLMLTIGWNTKKYFSVAFISATGDETTPSC
jgi:hypothetical protein